MTTMLTYKDVAELTNMKLGTVYALVSQRRIPHIRLGRRLVRFRRQEILDWLEAHDVEVGDVDAEVRA
jgi:excisionase family DNA binding protein